jgi:hypothetical protein
MKANPRMKIFVAGGYYDWATPFLEGIYEMHHLPIPDNLQANIRVYQRHGVRKIRVPAFAAPETGA